MPGLVPGIHVFVAALKKKDVDGRDKPGHDDVLYRPAFHSPTSAAISAAAGSRAADGVREKRGAGAGWVTPWRSMNTFRAAMCG
jgi:hypothetical protein